MVLTVRRTGLRTRIEAPFRAADMAEASRERMDSGSRTRDFGTACGLKLLSAHEKAMVVRVMMGDAGRRVNRRSDSLLVLRARKARCAASASWPTPSTALVPTPNRKPSSTPDTSWLATLHQRRRVVLLRKTAPSPRWRTPTYLPTGPGDPLLQRVHLLHNASIAIVL